MDDSFLVARCVEWAIQIMQFVHGKENFFALGKVILCSFLLGVS